MDKSSHKNRGISLNHYRFTPTLIPTIATLVMLCLLVNLGFWQIQRAHVKEALIARAQDRSQFAPLQLADTLAPNKDLADYPISISGTYLNNQLFYLDNKTHNGIAGYHILAPLLSEGKVILINRGWIPRGQDRTHLPPPPLIHDPVTINGRIHIPNPNYFVLKEDDYQKISWPLLIQKIDLEKSTQLFDHPLMPYVIRENSDPDSHFIRKWYYRKMGPEKHYGYALQWFSLAFALSTIYLVVNIHRKHNKN